MTDTEIRQLLALITDHTGLAFAPDTAQYLTDVFDLMVHIIIRLHDDYDTTHYFDPIPERIAIRLSLINYAPTLVATRLLTLTDSLCVFGVGVFSE